MFKKLLIRGMTPAAALAGAYLIIPWEGLETTPYEDVVGIKTICYGHTGRDIEDREYTLSECLDLLSIDVQQAEDFVNNTIKEPFISDYEKAAYISFTYNVGVGNLQVSTLANLINSGKHEEACAELVKWRYAGGRELRGLLNRRLAETKFCLGEITVDEYEEFIRKAEEQANQELEESVSNLQCLVPPIKLDHSCKYGGAFCPWGCIPYTFDTISYVFSRNICNHGYCGKNG